MLIKPKRPSVYLKKISREVFLNFVSIDDEVWIEEHCAHEKIREQLESQNMSLLMVLFWRIMDDESKRYIRDAKLVTWEGAVETELPSDPYVRLKAIIGADEMMLIFNAYLTSRMMSNPDPVATQKKSLKADES